MSNYNSLENPYIQRQLGYYGPSGPAVDYTGQIDSSNYGNRQDQWDSQPQDITDNTGQKDYGNPNQGYFEDPARIVKYNDLIRSTSADKIAANPWLTENAPNITTAYRYLQFQNSGKDPSAWTLPNDPKFTSYLRSFKQPPNEMLQSWEKDYTQQPVVDPTAAPTAAAPPRAD